MSYLKVLEDVNKLKSNYATGSIGFMAIENAYETVEEDVLLFALAEFYKDRNKTLSRLLRVFAEQYSNNNLIFVTENGNYNWAFGKFFEGEEYPGFGGDFQGKKYDFKQFLMNEKLIDIKIKK